MPNRNFAELILTVEIRGYAMKTTYLLALVLCLSFTTCPLAAKEQPRVYVTFWFDTEDFILPQADDAAKRLAEMFVKRHVKATFKIVGEKARVLEERGRDDVILALANNDIAYHSTYHSVHPTPSEYSRDLDWHEGVSEFIRREGAGLETLRHVFGVNASCYGQPGGYWTPQSYAALNRLIRSRICRKSALGTTTSAIWNTTYCEEIFKRI